MSNLVIKVSGDSVTYMKASVKEKNSSKHWLYVILINILVITIAYTINNNTFFDIKFSFNTLDQFLSLKNIMSISFILTLFNVLYIYFLSEQIVKENLIAIKNVGVQIEMKKRNGKKIKKFIDTTQVKDIVINESLSVFSVNTNLVLLTSGQKDLIVPFQKNKLIMEDIFKIYYPIREIIIKGQRDDLGSFGTYKESVFQQSKL